MGDPVSWDSLIRLTSQLDGRLAVKLSCKQAGTTNDTLASRTSGMADGQQASRAVTQPEGQPTGHPAGLTTFCLPEPRSVC